MAGSASFSRALAVVAAALALSAPAGAAPEQTRPGAAGKPARPAPVPPKRPDATAERLARTSADVLKAMRDYRASLDRLLAVYESDLARNTELVEERFAAFAKGQVTRLEIEDAELARLTAEENLAETRRWIEEADRLQLEANLSEYISRLPALSPGGFQSTDVLVRYVGTAAFGLIDAPTVQRFFLERFGRSLPVSAWGQTPAHDRFGFDHRNALDVAVHPDSGEGQILAEYLRRAGISFMAFRGAVPGAATGAHFHIGEPSRRITVPVRR
jgi:hypothetical protein